MGWLSVVQKLLIYWDFHAQPSLRFKEYGPKKRKYPVSVSSVGENALLMPDERRMARLVRADRKATVTQITNHGSIRPCINGSGCWCNGVLDIF